MKRRVKLNWALSKKGKREIENKWEREAARKKVGDSSERERIKENNKRSWEKYQKEWWRIEEFNDADC